MSIRIKSGNNHVHIDVIDNGPGLSEKVKEHLFERGSLNNGEQKGQGLYLTKSIIESNGGTIELLEEYTQGTAFRIILNTI